MSLQDLDEHIPAQEKAISEASSGFKPISTWSDVWVGLRDSLWGKPIESFEEEVPVERDKSDPVAGVVLPDKHFFLTFPEALLGSPWTLECERILVRSEYREAEQAAVSSSSSDCDVFVAAGQPGIGKSVFLIWLLMRRLARKLPTALQIDSSYAILFHEGGVFEFQDSKFNSDYRPLILLSENSSSRIWALVDTSLDLLEPFSIFKRSSPFFVVVAASPRSEHLGWLKKVSQDYFYMRPWSDSEVLQVSPFLGGNHTERRVWHLHKKFGASPRDLAGYANDPDRYRGLLVREITAVGDRASLQSTIQDPELSNLSHHLIVIGPLQDDRRVAEKIFASQEVFDMLWNEFLKDRKAEMARFYDLFYGTTRVSSSAGWIFEARMHQLLATGKPIRIFRIHGFPETKNMIYGDCDAFKEQEDPVDLEWATSEQYILPEDDSVELQEGRYYRPGSTSFPTIDSLLLLPPSSDTSPPILLMFQITKNQERHDVNPGDLHRVDRLKFPPNACKYYVVVTPKDAWPKITVSMEHFRGQPMVPDTLFSFFHYPVRELFTN